LIIALAFSVATFSSSVTVFGDPRGLLPDVHDRQQVLVQACILDHLAKGLFMHERGTGGNDHPVQVLLLDGILDELLSRRGTHEFIFFRDDNVGQAAGKINDLANPDRLGYI
jgi:hypothetical protein